MPDKDQEDKLMTEIYDLLRSDIQAMDIFKSLEAKMKEQDLSERQMSAILGLGRSSLKRFKDGEAQKLDLLTALKMIQFLGWNMDDFIKIYVSTLPKELIGELEKVRRANYLIENFDLKTLKKTGFIDSATDYDAIEQKIIHLFGLTSIFEYSLEVASPLFSRGKKKFSDKMLEFWVKSAYAKFSSIDNPNTFDKKGLEQLIPKIRPYTREEETGLLTVARALYHLGITVIVQPYLTKTHVKGMTMIVKGKPCIALSNYYNKYPSIWFTLLHELAHVYYHLESISSLNYHVSGVDDLWLIEPEANQFAREILFSEEKLNYILPLMASPRVVEQYAQQHKVHTSIVYALLIRHIEELHPGKDCSHLYATYSSHININPERAISALNTSAWGNNSVDEDVARVNQVFSNVIN